MPNTDFFTMVSEGAVVLYPRTPAACAWTEANLPEETRWGAARLVPASTFMVILMGLVVDGLTFD